MFDFINCLIEKSFANLNIYEKSGKKYQQVIKVNNLFKSYGAEKVVNNISFEVNEGQIACLVGTSGCGKTTTLKMINRLVTPDSGAIEVGLKSFADQDEINWRRKIGYVMQKGALLPHLTIKQNVLLLPKVLKQQKNYLDRFQELMDLVKIDSTKFSGRYPRELSGGQQQRIGLVRALIMDPSVLLMDEPFGALDPITRFDLQNELLEIHQRLKKTILIVTHDLKEAFKLGSKVLLMDTGKLIQSGNKEDFIKNPNSDFVREFVSKSL
jgi:osmoprotectant transport system ATP-binding protein